MGRIDDVINVSGHRLSTMEVESSLVSHDKVVEAAVVGRPDDVTGQAIPLNRIGGHGSDLENLFLLLRSHFVDLLQKLPINRL